MGESEKKMPTGPTNKAIFMSYLTTSLDIESQKQYWRSYAAFLKVELHTKEASDK